jgi:Tfp pilus assembly protein PilF
MRLAAYYETKGETEHAIAQYRRAIDADPQNMLALNNLAFALAETQHSPAEALPFAERAARLSSDTNILDTLGWVRHLLGQDQLAAPVLERAASARGASGEILLHAAIVQMAIDNLPRAKTELDAAVKLDPKLAERQDAKVLRAKVGGGGILGPEQ